MSFPFNFTKETVRTQLKLRHCMSFGTTVIDRALLLQVLSVRKNGYLSQLSSEVRDVFLTLASLSVQDTMKSCS